ncbi:MAG: protein kinase [Alphaproteobacteria bacterium]|jgi:osmotically-inducible protein OsmY/predicted Ser/Thr protein kinase|nr:protein kinase [Alphaproteobacteria bacterium]
MTNRDRPGPNGGARDTGAPTRGQSVGPNDRPDDDDATRIAEGPEHTLPPGTLLSYTYQIEHFIAKGGMGEVYRARHVDLGTRHAIKIIQTQFAQDAKIVGLFRREAAILRTIRDDAIVGYDGVFRDERGRLFLSMEFVDGPSLKDLLRERPFTASEIRRLRDRLASGLAAAHEKGIIHRDLSPDNVILPDGLIENAKIIDFGIAKLEDPEVSTIIGDSFAGKLSYASPEQLGMYGGEIGPPSDIYSLGLILAAAASGKPLDMGKTTSTVVEARRTVPDLNGIPAELRDELSKMLAPEPKDRPQTMRALIGLGEPKGRAAGSPAGRPRGGMPWGAVGGGLAALAAVAAGVYVFVVDPSIVPGLSGNGNGNGGVVEDGNGGTGGTGDVTPPNGSDRLPPERLQAIRAEAERIVGRFDCADISIDVNNDGRVEAFGSIGTRADLRSLQEDLADIRDVSAVEDDVAIVPCPETDRDLAAIERSVGRIVDSYSCADVSVDIGGDGRVSLFGTLGNSSDIRSLTDRVARLDGVAGIDNALAVSPCPVERPTREAVMAEVRRTIDGAGCGDITASLGDDYRLAVTGTVPRRQEAAMLRRELADIRGVAAVDPTLAVGPCEPAPDEVPDDPELAALSARIADITAYFRCADISTRVQDDGRVIVAGHVGSDRDAEAVYNEIRALEGVTAVEGSLDVYLWPFCEVVSLVNEHTSLTHGGPVILPNHPDGQYRVGDVLIVEATASTRFDGFLYVEYIDRFDNQGNVAHLMPSSARPDATVVAGETVRLGVRPEEAEPNQSPYIIGEPVGRKMLLAISSPEPLFSDGRPPYAEARQYLDALSQALRRAERNGSGEPLATFMMLEVEP